MHDGATSRNPDTGAIAGLFNGGIGRGRGRTRREFLRSGNERGGASLGVRAGPGAEQVRGAVEPEHALRLLVRRRDRSLRRVNRPAGMGDAAHGTAAVMRARRTGLIALIVG